MKRWLALGIPLLVLAGVLITYVTLERRRTPDWETVLNDYLSRAASHSEVIVVLSVCEASKPSNFTAAMGMAVPSEGTFDDLELPFPPRAVHGVLLQRKHASASGASHESVRQVIYVAYHSDKLWHMGWMVHAGPQEPFSAQLAADLQAIGCDLELD